ncbi:hypothetical protein QU38_00250, partial [Staphylococcus aureus]
MPHLRASVRTSASASTSGDQAGKAADMAVFKLGTRGSPLALTQAEMVRDALAAAHKRPATDFEIVVIRTTGDKVQDRPLAEIGGKALW